jgi:DNA-binding response OmpR family regulator
MLVVDDDVEFVASLAEGLTTHAPWVHARHVADGGTAIAVLSEPVTPDVILLDLNLSIISGFDLLRRLRADPRFQTTVIVVIGSSGNPGVDRNSFLPGEVWMPKPFDVDDLLTVVDLVRDRIGGAVRASGFDGRDSDRAPA